jgi:hypothetical protein
VVPKVTIDYFAAMSTNVPWFFVYGKTPETFGSADISYPLNNIPQNIPELYFVVRHACLLLHLCSSLEVIVLFDAMKWSIFCFSGAPSNAGF